MLSNMRHGRKISTDINITQGYKHHFSHLFEQTAYSNSNRMPEYAI